MQHFVIVYLKQGTVGTVLWNTETNDLSKANSLAVEMTAWMPEHEFVVRDEEAAMRIFRTGGYDDNGRAEVDTMKVVSMARLVC